MNDTRYALLSESVSIDDERDVLTAFGIKIAGELLRAFATVTPPGRWMRVHQVADGVCTIQQRDDLIPRGTKPRAVVPLRVRPMLVAGQLATDARGPIILIDSEAEEAQQELSLWHEVAHLIGIQDEQEAEALASKLAAAAPGILRKLAHNINVPDSQ